ncbi:hypothetical protein [Algoriphagus hitonicola]|uniref:Uncharacterized protein n=1 Tax=Algoriphagus hitonicola TaxID=435880 RepID=A0A1I2XAH0_9BACT|nr:hypothetical protein [Algoriphagus hitonicola]SFH10498.1 hypothetical protein SAMN04487988_11749 [Algoriphagus hitonicola]
MDRFRALFYLVILMLFASCDREVEVPTFEQGYDFQPLLVGSTWTYSVDETIYFGENDSEDSSYFLRDHIRTIYVNDAREQVFVLARYRSPDQESWEFDQEYTLLVREDKLIRTVNNQPEVVLDFPLIEGKKWDGNLFRNANSDEYELQVISSSESDAQVKILQEESDDEITFRDNRYEVFQKGVGLVEKYAEVLTYCSRNDCLGEQLIDSGSKLHMNLLSYERQ